MKLKYTSRNNRIQADLDVGTAKEAFKALAEVQEIFDESQCGMCEGDDIHFRVRTVDGNDYYEMACRKCGAKLDYGQHKAGGGLFPKRKRDGKYENQGWYRWNSKN